MHAAKRPTVPEVLPYVTAIYARNSAGCCLHILTDDGNVDDGSAEFVSRTAVEAGRADCIRAASMLRQMSKTQRAKVAGAKKR